jgi:hypothetical protein
MDGMTSSALGQMAVNFMRGCEWDTNLLQALLSGGLSGGAGSALGWAAGQVKKAVSKTLSAVAGDPDDLAIQLAKNAKPLPGVYDVIAHGKPSGLKLFLDGKSPWASAKELATWILKQEDYVPGTPIRLVSCHAGSSPLDGGLPIAAELANEMKVEVIAADTWVQPNLDGTLSLVDITKTYWDTKTSMMEYVPAGNWKLFTPDVVRWD